uniref:Uncharacterized protein n=1 Tax=uncultured Armatimonadetes bacterium TaxID=157466 RepID=A0A6J4I2B9_9BACT|nr:hypothetical protein AVDCRST_MAG63-1344 [uncultured Armatimonadetes bacterium]
MTPEEAASRHFIRLFPGFAADWEQEDLLREDDGSFTLCGLFAAISTFLRDRAATLTPEERRRFGDYVNHHFHQADEPARDALGACLIENLEGYAFTRDLFAHVAPEVLRQFRVEA